MSYIPTQHAHRGILTPFDVSFHPKFIESFLIEKGASLPCIMELPEAGMHFGSIINPLKALMTATTVMLEIF